MPIRHAGSGAHHNGGSWSHGQEVQLLPKFFNCASTSLCMWCSSFSATQCESVLTGQSQASVHQASAHLFAALLNTLCSTDAGTSFMHSAALAWMAATRLLQSAGSFFRDVNHSSSTLAKMSARAHRLLSAYVHKLVASRRTVLCVCFPVRFHYRWCAKVSLRSHTPIGSSVSFFPTPSPASLATGCSIITF